MKCSVPSCKLEFFSLKNLRIHLKKFHSYGTKNSNEIKIKKEKLNDFGDANLDEKESELLEELDPNIDDSCSELEENADESFKFYNNSFLNSTEKSEKLSNSKSNKQTKKSNQLKISTCFSLNGKKEEKNPGKPKSTGSSVSYECCECKINFPGNTELWDHLLAVHSNKLKSNVKKS
jgi:hypothetical protein